MGFFDGLSETVFKEDEDGNSIFYKWGVMGRGVVVDTEERREAILSFVSNYYAATFIMVFVMNFSIFFLHTDIFQTTMLFLGVAIIMMAWYLKKTTELTHGLEYSDTKLTMENGWQKTAHRLPKYVLWGGLVMMLILIALSIGSLIYFDDFARWAGIVLLVTGVFGTYAYYRMIIYSKEVKPPEVLEIKTPDEPSAESMEWNAKNISIIGTLLVIVIGFVYYVYADSKKDFDERMAKYNKMSTEEMALYLADLNDGVDQIDPITMHTGAKAQDNIISLYRELESNIVSDMIVDIENIEDEKSRMSRQLKREMCGSPTYDLFYEKGGELLYIYHLVEDEKKTFLFDVKINKLFCL